MSSRKHISQMNEMEKAFIHGYIRANAHKANANHVHFYHRASDRHYTLAEATEVLQNGLVVEVHDLAAPSYRAVVRDRKGNCVVTDLRIMTVITVYYNDPEDKHEGLNWSAYRLNTDIVELVKKIRKAAQ